jgi:flagellin-like hook-associated protein FlgL
MEANQAQWNGQKLLNGARTVDNSTSAFNLQIGAEGNSNNTMKFDLFNSNNVNFATGTTGFSSGRLGLGSGLDISKPFAEAGFNNFVDGQYSVVHPSLGFYVTAGPSNISNEQSVSQWLTNVNNFLYNYGNLGSLDYDPTTDKFTLTVNPGKSIGLGDYAGGASWNSLAKIPAGWYTSTVTSSSTVSNGGNSPSVSTTTLAQDLLKKVDNAIATVSSALSYIGSIVNRLGYQENGLTVAKVNTEAARSRIEDADMAEEQVNATKFQILQQTSSTMLAQANFSPQTILSLFK